MELRAGYKKTEIGVIPEDWLVATLESITDSRAPIRYGVVQIGPDTPDGVPIVPIKSIKEISTAQLPRSAKSIEARFTGSRISGGDVLLSVKGTIGRVGIVPKEFRGNIAREIARLRVLEKEVPLFVMYQIEGNHTQRRINDAVVGTTRLEFSIAAVRKFAIEAPSTRAERESIAQVLLDIDEMISALSRLIAKKCHLREGAMQRLLSGESRLSDFSGPWSLMRLADLALLQKGKQLPSGTVMSSGLAPYYNGGVDPSGYTSMANTSGETVAISEGGNSCGFVHFIDEPFWCGGHCYALRPKTVDSRFLYYCLKRRQLDIMALRVGSGLPNIQKGALEDFEILVPQQIEEQRTIARILTEMYAEIAALDARLDKSRALKQAMMQGLLTGRVRLPVRRDAAPQTKEAAHA